MTIWSLLCIVFGFALSAFFSGVETGSYVINRIRLRYRELHRRPAAKLLARLLGEPHIFVFTVLIGNNIAVYLLTKEVTDLYMASHAPGWRLFGMLPMTAEVAATLTLTIPLFILAEVGPKNLFHKKSDTLMYRLAPLIKFFVLLFYPFTYPLKLIYGLLTRYNPEEPPGVELHRLSPEGLRDYFSDGARDGVLSSQQSRMMEKVSSMHCTKMRSVMTPVNRVPRLKKGATVADFKQTCAQHRMPVALLLEAQQVVGMVSMFSVVNRQLVEDAVLDRYAEEMLCIEEGRNLKFAFYRLRKHPRHCAVVVDARRHPVGFVTLEDIARFLAGE